MAVSPTAPAAATAPLLVGSAMGYSRNEKPGARAGFSGNLLIGCNCAQWQNDTQMLFKSSSDPFQAFPLGPVGRHAVMVALMDTGAFQDVLAPLLPVCLPYRFILAAHRASSWSDIPRSRSAKRCW